MNGNQADNRRTALNIAAETLWYVPGSFSIARFLGSQYSLRCVTFHDISDAESCFTKGLGVTITQQNLEAALRFIVRHYTPVSLQDVVTDYEDRELPSRPLLVTFDDAYASVCEFAAPLCATFGVPAVFFINGACLDNRQFALDNLACYVANVCGLETINSAIRCATGTGSLEVCSLAEVFSRFLPLISQSTREIFRGALVDLARIDEGDLAAEAALYVSSQKIRDLATFNFEIGNHTYTHAYCRLLSAGEVAEEVDRNEAVLEAASGTKVRSFSVPYGSSFDLTNQLAAHLQHSGYRAIFLAEGCANALRADRLHLDRISIKGGTDDAFFSEIEIFPRLRIVRNLLFGTRNAQPRRMIWGSMRQPPQGHRKSAVINAELPNPTSEIQN